MKTDVVESVEISITESVGSMTRTTRVKVTLEDGDKIHDLEQLLGDVLRKAMKIAIPDESHSVGS